MDVPATKVKELREKTGVAMMECKKALVESQGDLEKAVEYLRRRGLAQARLKEGRPTSEGKVGAYIHAGGKIGVLVEVDTETDFVANTPEFAQFVKDVAMQIVAANPLYIAREDIPEEVIKKEEEIYRAEAIESGKQGQAVERLVEGRLYRFIAEACLLEQPFIRNQDMSVSELLGQLVNKVGENVTIRRFARFRVGEGPVPGGGG